MGNEKFVVFAKYNDDTLSFFYFYTAVEHEGTFFALDDISIAFLYCEIKLPIRYTDKFFAYKNLSGLII